MDIVANNLTLKDIESFTRQLQPDELAHLSLAFGEASLDLFPEPGSILLLAENGSKTVLFKGTRTTLALSYPTENDGLYITSASIVSNNIFTDPTDPFEPSSVLPIKDFGRAKSFLMNIPETTIVYLDPISGKRRRLFAKEFQDHPNVVLIGGKGNTERRFPGTTRRGSEFYFTIAGIEPESLRDKRILNVGSGRSDLGRYLTEHGIHADVTNVDINPNISTPNLIHVDILDLGSEIAPNTMDVVFCTYLWSLLAEGDVKQSLHEMLNTLTNNGILYIYPAFDLSDTNAGIEYVKNLLAEKSGQFKVSLIRPTFPLSLDINTLDTSSKANVNLAITGTSSTLVIKRII